MIVQSYQCTLATLAALRPNEGAADAICHELRKSGVPARVKQNRYTGAYEIAVEYGEVEILNAPSMDAIRIIWRCDEKIASDAREVVRARERAERFMERLESGAISANEARQVMNSNSSNTDSLDALNYSDYSSVAYIPVPPQEFPIIDNYTGSVSSVPFRFDPATFPLPWPPIRGIDEPNKKEGSRREFSEPRELPPVFIDKPLGGRKITLREKII